MPDADRLMDVRELSRTLAICRSLCWRFAAEARAGLRDFPVPVRLKPRIVRWRQSEVQAYISGLAERANVGYTLIGERRRA